MRGGSRGRRSVVVLGALVGAFVFSGQAYALDHVSITTHDVAVANRVVKKKPPPFCKKGQKSTKRYSCRKRTPHVAALQSPPDAGWQFGLSLGQNADGTWGLSVALSRNAGNTTELHNYTFKLDAGSVTVAPDLSSVSLDTGTQLGQFGSMQLTLGNVGALAGGTPAAGCSNGTWQTRSGTLTGKVSFVADSTYFQTIMETSLPADVSANTGDPPACGSPPVSCGSGTTLAVINPQPPNLFVTSAVGSVSLTESIFHTVGPAQILDLLSERNLPASDLTVASDLSTATVSTTGSTAFTGSLSYTASAAAIVTNPDPICGGTRTVRQGTSTGGIVGHFRALPAAAPPTGNTFITEL